VRALTTRQRIPVDDCVAARVHHDQPVVAARGDVDQPGAGVVLAVADVASDRDGAETPALRASMTVANESCSLDT